MKVTKFKSDKIISLNAKKYYINWEKDGDSSLEIKFRDLIYPYWKNSIILFQCAIPGSRLELDFLNINKRLCVEVDGEQHNNWNPFFYNNNRNNFVRAFKRDLDKESWCEKNSIKMLHLDKKDLDNFSPENILKNFNIDIT